MKPNPYKPPKAPKPSRNIEEDVFGGIIVIVVGLMAILVAWAVIWQWWEWLR